MAREARGQVDGGSRPPLSPPTRALPPPEVRIPSVSVPFVSLGSFVGVLVLGVVGYCGLSR